VKSSNSIPKNLSTFADEPQLFGNFRNFFRVCLTQITLYLRGPEKKLTCFLLISEIFLIISTVVLMGVASYWQRGVYDAFQIYNWSLFIRQMWLFVPLALSIIMVGVLRHYVGGILSLKWRRLVTKHYIDEWLSHRSYYLLHMNPGASDNPDQRLAEDLRIFTSETLTLFFTVLEAIFTVFMFVAILWQLSGTLHLSLGGYGVAIPGYLVFVALGYAGLGTWITHKTTRRLLPLDFDLERREGNFRHALVRLRENSESIALYGGEAVEKGLFKKLFEKIYTNTAHILRVMLGVNLWITSYGQIALILPFIFMAPQYFREHLAIGILMQTAISFQSVQGALSTLIKSYPQIVSWRASTLRILGFQQRLEQLHHIVHTSEIKRKESTTSPHIFINDLEIQNHEGQTIVRLPKRILKKNENILLQGPSGLGKSTFLKALSGIWPYGRGEIEYPARGQYLFLPQKSYIPMGTLKGALAYPNLQSDYQDQMLREVLEAVGLGRLKDQLDASEVWSNILSGGELQRLAFARLLLQKPDWAFLDEATSALDSVSEKQLYTLLKRYAHHTTYLSVGHKATLSQFHDTTWSLRGKG
jgi:putative ATP-binding cassette transporter